MQSKMHWKSVWRAETVHIQLPRWRASGYSNLKILITCSCQNKILIYFLGAFDGFLLVCEGVGFCFAVFLLCTRGRYLCPIMNCDDNSHCWPWDVYFSNVCMRVSGSKQNSAWWWTSFPGKEYRTRSCEFLQLWSCLRIGFLLDTF